MFKYAFTYLQVMPTFLDFIFPFGFQEHQEDFHFTGFRQETRLLGNERGLKIAELERSGQDTQVCYSLKSVERSSDPKFPWSIRQTAAYHSFDFGTGNAAWIIVKGNQLMKDRIKDSSNDVDVFKSLGGAFNASLDSHLMICSWCAEEWRWYANFLESTLQEMTRRSLAIRVVKAPSIMAMEDEIHDEQLKPDQNRTFSWASRKKISTKKIPTLFLTPEQANGLELLPTYEIQPRKIKPHFLAHHLHPRHLLPQRWPKKSVWVIFRNCSIWKTRSTRHC